MKLCRKRIISAAAAMILILSGCQQNQVIDNGNITLESIEATEPQDTEETTETTEETTVEDTTTTPATTTTAKTTRTTTSASTTESEEPEEAAEADETEAAPASTEGGVFTVPPTTAATVATAAYTPTPAVSAGSTGSGNSTAAAQTTAAPRTVVVTDSTQPHVSGYRYGNVKYEIKHDLEYMKDLNSDFIGWLKIDDTPIDLPVVQATDNKFYLEHDFYGAYDYTKVGTTFADCHIPVTATSGPDNLVIYGHNIRTGVGLAKITNYYPARYGSLNFYINHPLFTYESVYGGQSYYVVFAGMFVNTDTKHGAVFNYHRFRSFDSESVFYQYFEAVMDRSVFYNPDLDIKYGDKFITLSTCYYPFGANVDTRFVVFARQLRPGETTVTSKNAYTNRSPLYFDYYYAVNGGSWAGRNWPSSLIQGYATWKANNS